MSGLNLDVKASNISLSICLNFNSYLMALFFNNLISTSKFLTAFSRRILLSSSCSPKINFGLNLFGNTGISLSSHVS